MFMAMPIPRLAAALLTLCLTSSVICRSPDSSVLMGRDATRRMTNAERLSRGLPPNKPARRLPGMKARDGPSATLTTTSPTSSPTPPACGLVAGMIRVERSGEFGFEYMDNGDESDSNYPESVDLITAEMGGVKYMKNTIVTSNYGSWKIDTCAAGPVSVSCLNCPEADTLPCLGVYINNCDASQGYFDPSCMGWVTLIPETRNVPAAGISLYSDSPGAIQSNIWFYNSTTNALSLQWANPNGSSIPLTIGAYQPQEPQWFSPVAFTTPSTNGGAGDWAPVTFTFIPDR